MNRYLLVFSQETIQSVLAGAYLLSISFINHYYLYFEFQSDQTDCGIAVRKYILNIGCSNCIFHKCRSKQPLLS